VAAHRRPPRWPRQPLLLDRLLARAAPAVAQRHRPARVIRSLDLGDTAAHRHDRRAVHDPARGTFWLNRPESCDAYARSVDLLRGAAWPCPPWPTTASGAWSSCSVSAGTALWMPRS